MDDFTPHDDVRSHTLIRAAQGVDILPKYGVSSRLHEWVVRISMCPYTTTGRRHVPVGVPRAALSEACITVVAGYLRYYDERISLSRYGTDGVMWHIEKHFPHEVRDPWWALYIPTAFCILLYHKCPTSMAQPYLTRLRKWHHVYAFIERYCAMAQGQLLEMAS